MRPPFGWDWEVLGFVKIAAWKIFEFLVRHNYARLRTENIAVSELQLD